MTLFLQLFDRILPNLEKLQFFLVVCPYLAVFGDKWHVWRILINIGNILKTYWKVARLDNIEQKLKNMLKTYWKHIWKTTRVMITPACVQLRIRSFGIYAVWPKIWSYASWPKNTVVWGSRYIYTYYLDDIILFILCILCIDGFMVRWWWW